MEFIRNLKIVENEWGIGIKVIEEWEGTFDKLLSYYNTKDLRSICEESCCGTRSICDKMCCVPKTLSHNKLISLDELWKWMTPQMEPPIWKWILGLLNRKMEENYDKEKTDFKNQFDSMKNNCSEYINLVERMNGIGHVENVGRKKDKEQISKIKMISKRDIIGFIMGELRRGDKRGKEVII